MNVRRVKVARRIESRYSQGHRPLSWDDRVGGDDVVETVEGEVLRLSSSGQQSCPDRGWEILITGGDETSGFTWTLYGLGEDAIVADA